MENINYLYNQYNHLVDNINSEQDLEKREKLQSDVRKRYMKK